MTPLLVPLHGLGSRQDLPLPLPAAVGGAVLVLLLSFAVLALAWREPRWDGAAGGRALPGLTRFVDARWFRAILAALGVFAFLWVGAALWFGRDRVTNPVFGFTYVWLWVGLVPLSLLFGPLYRLANPLGRLARLLQLSGLPAGGLRPLSRETWRRLGSFPAAVGLLGFSWLELVQPDNNTLAVLQGWWLAWVGAVIGGTVLFGRRWVAAADPFQAYAVLVSRASPWQRVDGVVHLVNPLRHLSTARTPAGTWAVVAVLLGGTAFDGFTSTSWWVRTTQSSGLPRELWGTLGLLAHGGPDRTHLRARRPGNRTPPARGPPEPAGRQRDPDRHRLRGGALPEPARARGPAHADQPVRPAGPGLERLRHRRTRHLSRCGSTRPVVTSTVQLLAIIGGHVIGVLVAHELALRVLPVRRRLTGQVPLLLVMIGYTCGGLLLLFSP